MSFSLYVFAYSEASFNGFGGAMLDFGAKKDSSSFEPSLKMKTFFAGQINFSENITFHGEISFKTGDLIEKSVFKESDAKFKVDELSLVFRNSGYEVTNYFSIFLGTYEPIGSDIFLRRHFGIQSIASKITESYLGTSGSVIYPLIGTGISDVIQFDSTPIALGFYTYVNHELDDSYVFNFDGRFASVFQYLKLDFSTGIGTPLNTDYYDDAYFVVNKLYWRAGFNLLLGNPYSFSIFVQAGASEIPFSKDNEKISFSEINKYLLFEPRLNFTDASMDLTFYSLPKDTVEDLIYIENTLGINLNIYSSEFYIKNGLFVIGLNTSASIEGKDISDFDKLDSLFENGFDISIYPYISRKMLLNGDLNASIKIDFSEFADGNWQKGIGITIGYKTQF